VLYLVYTNKGDDIMKKYNIGDVVQICPDLKVGQMYYNEGSSIGDTFTHSMRKNLGKVGRIVAISQGTYFLDIDSVHGYTDSMLQYPNNQYQGEDVCDYRFNPEVEKLIIHMEALHLAKQIDEAIDNGDKVLFMQLSEEYNKKMNFLATVS
jgi:hypothetical protein